MSRENRIALGHPAKQNILVNRYKKTFETPVVIRFIIKQRWQRLEKLGFDKT